MACSGVELALSWLSWYEGNIVVDLHCGVADERYVHPWRVTSSVLSGVCDFSGLRSLDLEYVKIGSRLLDKIQKEYSDSYGCDSDAEEFGEWCNLS